ncbi:curli production assembly protein CsgF [Stutzerimonas stutzeri]|uniref:Curli production assembly/transport component CsgF n=1 Tax=Stutzerimonas stutzeri TaxID=316 RepID=W8QWJ4_STUST|nr:curli assembly protein CsgF [Stutzerimonas stutzeri]AHL74664.1 curli production assembly protein CsgF [Stutzerimonas stutzeri]MCQ4329194.1 curli assembly protein CsgF [Stutzerimonas stutzeri]
MNRSPQKITGMLLAGFFFSTGVTATELVYTPVNPSFGGSPLNGAWLLGNAQAQNDTTDPDAIDRSSLTGTSALDRFTSQLESRLLSDLLNTLDDPNGGTLQTDDFLINVVNLDGNLTVEITDRLTGEVSEIVVNGYGAAAIN